MSHDPQAKPVLEPHTAAYVDGLVAAGGPPLYTLSPAEARKVLAGLQAGERQAPQARIENTVWSTPSAGPVRVRIVRPMTEKEALPVVVYLHGGGWVLGDCDTHDRLARDLAVGAEAAVVLVDYERSPEVKYPVALEQAYAAAYHAAKNAEALGFDASLMAVAGDSAGGNLAAALTLLAKERGGPRFKLQVLFYPVTDANLDTPSYRAFQDGPWLTRPAMAWFWGNYLPDVSLRTEVTASPLLASLDELSSLPEALVITAEVDVLRDEGEAYGRRLTEAGVRTTMVRVLGTIHDFVMLDALRATPAAELAIRLAVNALRSAFR